MDLDRHEPLSSRYLDCVPEMLNLFNNETENGKLYISYPMVEAFKHPISDINHQISKIEWHCFDEAEIDVINNFVEQNLRNELKGKNLFKIIKH